MKLSSVINFLIFTCFLVIGYTFSLRFYQPDASNVLSPVKIVAAESQNSIQAMKNGQRTLMFISASNLDSLNQRLESVWLATYFPSDTTLQWLPIFPAGDATLSEFEQDLLNSFKLNKQVGGIIIDPGFLHVLQENNYWWSGYILLDETSLAKIFTQLGGIDLNGKTLYGAQVVSELLSEAENPRNAYSSQVALIQSICHKFSQVDTKLVVTQLQSMIPDHILTDLDARMLKAEFDALYSNKHNPTCRFPTLEVSRIEP